MQEFKAYSCVTSHGLRMRSTILALFAVVMPRAEWPLLSAAETRANPQSNKGKSGMAGLSVFGRAA